MPLHWSWNIYSYQWSFNRSLNNTRVCWRTGLIASEDLIIELMRFILFECLYLSTRSCSLSTSQINSVELVVNILSIKAVDDCVQCLSVLCLMHWINAKLMFCHRSVVRWEFIVHSHCSTVWCYLNFVLCMLTAASTDTVDMLTLLK